MCITLGPCFGECRRIQDSAGFKMEYFFTLGSFQVVTCLKGKCILCLHFASYASIVKFEDRPKKLWICRKQCYSSTLNCSCLKSAPFSTPCNLSEGCLTGKYSGMLHFQSHAPAILEEKSAVIHARSHEPACKLGQCTKKSGTFKDWSQATIMKSQRP